MFVMAREIYSQLLCVWQAECKENQKPRSEKDLTETSFLVQYVSGSVHLFVYDILFNT